METSRVEKILFAPSGLNVDGGSDVPGAMPQAALFFPFGAWVV
jgi:hypothetical protein